MITETDLIFLAVLLVAFVVVTITVGIFIRLTRRD